MDFKKKNWFIEGNEEKPFSGYSKGEANKYSRETPYFDKNTMDSIAKNDERLKFNPQNNSYRYDNSNIEYKPQKYNVKGKETELYSPDGWEALRLMSKRDAFPDRYNDDDNYLDHDNYDYDLDDDDKFANGVAKGLGVEPDKTQQPKKLKSIYYPRKPDDLNQGERQTDYYLNAFYNEANGDVEKAIDKHISRFGQQKPGKKGLEEEKEYYRNLYKKALSDDNDESDKLDKTILEGRKQGKTGEDIQKGMLEQINPDYEDKLKGVMGLDERFEKEDNLIRFFVNMGYDQANAQKKANKIVNFGEYPNIGMSKEELDDIMNGKK